MKQNFSAFSALSPFSMTSDKEALTLDDVRSAIDAADEILLRAIATRMKAVAHLKAIKDAKGLPVKDPVRERIVKSQWKEKAIALGIKPELALLILDFLLEDSKRIQRAS